MKPATRYLLAALALSSFFFVFPPGQHRHIDSSGSLPLLLLASVGILLSRIFVLSSDNSDKIGIEPAVLVCLATWNCPFLIYPVTVILTFSGSIINSIRMEQKLPSRVPEAIFQGVSFAFLLRFASFLYLSFQGLMTGHGAIRTYLAISAVVVPVTLLRCVSVFYSNGQKSKFTCNLVRNLTVNSFILLLSVPGALAILRAGNTTFILLSCTFGLFSMLVVYGINLRQNRSAHEKTDELETVMRLKELSGNLFSATSEMDVLKTLSRAVSAAWDCRVAVRWKSLTYFQGEKWDTTNAVSVQHSAGLCIRVDSFSSTIPVYLESFLNRAVPVLTSLEAEKKMKKTSWESMEAMISFVEQNNSDFAGFSRRVAITTTKLCRALKMDLWFEDCMRLAGLLHMVSLPKKSEVNISELPHALPEITLQALEGMMEHWSGTGPDGKTQDEIPLPSRILAVSIAWEKAINSGTAMAIRDMNMRAGTIYDPRLAKLVIRLNS